MSNISDPIYRLLVETRVQLLFDKPFFGNLAARLILVDASSWCNTAATDGKHLFYNRDFIKSLSKDELMFLLAHEILHCVYDHLGRRGGRNPQILNMAQDYVINYTLVQDKCGAMPKNGLIDNRFNDTMLSEEVYDILIKESVTIKMTLDMHLDLGDDSKDDEDGEGKGGGSGGSGGSGSGNNEVEVTIMGKNGPPKVTEEDLQRIRAEMKAAVIQAAQQAGAGNIPKGIARMIDDLINPKLDWRALLDAHIRSSVKDDYTFQRPSRVSAALRFAMSEARAEQAMDADNEHFDGELDLAHHDEDGDMGIRVPMLPSQDYMDTVDIMVAIDASGSMTEEMLRDQLSEVKGIMQTFREFRVRVLTFDTKVYNYREFTGENIQDIDNYPCDGGGGTMFECVWEYMKREGIEPHRLVLFTDGLPNSSWGDENYVDTLFVIHTNTNIKAPFGITAYYEPNSK